MAVLAVLIFLIHERGKERDRLHRPTKLFPTLLIGQAGIKEKDVLVNPTVVVAVGTSHTAQQWWVRVRGEP